MHKILLSTFVVGLMFHQASAKDLTPGYAKLMKSTYETDSCSFFYTFPKECINELVLLEEESMALKDKKEIARANGQLSALKTRLEGPVAGAFHGGKLKICSAMKDPSGKGAAEEKDLLELVDRCTFEVKDLVRSTTQEKYKDESTRAYDQALANAESSAPSQVPVMKKTTPKSAK